MLEYFALANPPRRRSYPTLGSDYGLERRYAGPGYGKKRSSSKPKKKRRSAAQKRATAKLVAANKRKKIAQRLHKARLDSSRRRSAKSRARNLSAAKRHAARRRSLKALAAAHAPAKKKRGKRKKSSSSGARRRSSSSTKPKRSRKAGSARGKGSAMAKKRRKKKGRSLRGRARDSRGRLLPKGGKRKGGKKRRKGGGGSKRSRAARKAAATRRRNKAARSAAARKAARRRGRKGGRRRGRRRRIPRLSAKVRGRSRKRRVVYVKGARRARWRRRGKTGGILVLRNPGGLSGFKGNLKSLLKPANYVDAAQVALGIGASLALPVWLARYSGKSQINRGVLGVAASAVSSAALAAVVSALGQHKLAGRLLAGGFVGTTLKLAFQFVPSSLLNKVLPLGELRGSAGALPAAPAQAVGQFIPPSSIAGMNELLSPSQLIAGESVFGGGMRDYLELGMSGMHDYMEFNATNQLPQVAAMADSALAQGGERF